MKTMTSCISMLLRLSLLSPSGVSVKDRGAAHRWREKGFTVIELLIAMFITAVISTAIYTIYTNYYRQSTTQDMVLEAQQNARVAINMIERELMNAGYSTGGFEIITVANQDQIEFTYKDPSTDATMSSTATKTIRVKYALDTVNKVITRTVDDLNDATDVPAPREVIPYVNGFTVAYNDLDGAQIPYADMVGTSAAAQDARASIKFATVKLVTETRDIPQGATARKTFAVDTQIRLRNIGVGTSSYDVDPPDAPTGLEVRDPRVCGRLMLKWDDVSDGGLAGYKIYYGDTPGAYNGVINIPLSMLENEPTYKCTRTAGPGGTVECTIFAPSSPALDSSLSDGSSTTTYYFAVKAYDVNFNHSGYNPGAPISGNPTPSNSSFATAGQDSTINPVKPSAVTGFTAADGPVDGQVSLSWSAYDTANNPDVAGFRIYRSSSPFTSYPIDPTAADIDWIAGEPGSGKPTVNPADTSYTDPGSGLVGCDTYYYAIAPVNCDATLVTDDGGDPPSIKYVQTDYDATCGDGSTACSAGTGFASVTGSDTSPPDSSAPSAPTNFTPRAGWKRVAVSFTQPPLSTDPDLSHTCIYSIESSTYPSLLTTRDAYNCYDVSSPGIRLFESGGVFDTTEVPLGQTHAFWHNSMTQLTSTPELLETGTYSYRAVSIDRCGNASNPADAQATTTLCGEDPIGKPPAVSGLTASACGGTPEAVSLTWTGVSSSISSPSSPTNPWDLAGYRVVRAASNDAAGWTAGIVLNSAPLWGTALSDTTTTEGGTYYYRVASTDCPYEKGDDTGGTPPTDAQLKSHMLSGYISSMWAGPYYPGRIGRDEKCPGVGSCTKDDHREVLTGVNLDNTFGSGTGASLPKATLTHDTVTIFLENTSAGSMTITKAEVLWVESTALLREVKVGGGRSGVGTTTTNISSGATTTVSGNPPYTRGVYNAALTPSVINASARYVPITFRFENSVGKPVDMREDQLLVTLDVTNDSTGTSTCFTYLTVSGSQEGIPVPPGPTVTSTQQNRPSSPTFSYAVPGATGLNTVPSGSAAPVEVDAGFTVTVTASIAGNTTDPTTGSKVPVLAARLFYTTTSDTVTTPPASGYTQVAMTNTSGSSWSADIPSSNGRRIWYFIVAVDSDGNFDRDPEIAAGAYVYDQKVFDVCDVTPNPPTSLGATVSGSDVTLTWTAPATYTNTAPIDPTDTIRYNVFKDGVQVATGLTSTWYKEFGVSTGVHYYYVRATNACSTPNVSSNSNTAADCVGLSADALLGVSPTAILHGQSYTVTIIDCLAAFDSSVVNVVNLDVSYSGFNNTSNAPGSFAPIVAESGPATGLFEVTIGTTGDVMDSTKLLTLKTDTITVTYPYASPSTRTISVTPDPCDDTPRAPTGLTGVPGAGNTLDLSWTDVTFNTNGDPLIDLAGYRVYEKVCAEGKPDCTGGDIVADWFVRTTVGAGTTTATLSADQGPFHKKIYYFRATAIDTCGTPNESAPSSEWNEAL